MADVAVSRASAFLCSHYMQERLAGGSDLHHVTVLADDLSFAKASVVLNGAERVARSGVIDGSNSGHRAHLRRFSRRLSGPSRHAAVEQAARLAALPAAYPQVLILRIGERFAA